MVTSRSATRGTAFLAPAIVALIALLAPRADALKIDFPPDGKDIAGMSAVAGDTFSGSFMLIEEGAVLKRWDGVFDLTVRDESRNVVYTARHTSEHRFEFNSEKAGAHEFCFTNLKPRPSSSSTTPPWVITGRTTPPHTPTSPISSARFRA